MPIAKYLANHFVSAKATVTPTLEQTKGMELKSDWLLEVEKELDGMAGKLANCPHGREQSRFSRVPQTTNTMRMTARQLTIKNIRHRGIVTLMLMAGGAAMVFSGCGTTKGYKQAARTGAGIAEFRDEIVKGKGAIDATMKSLGDIAATANTDPRKAFNQFSKDVANLDSTADKIRKRAQSMKEQGEAYFKQWETELTHVNNPEIRSLAEQRRAKLQETFQSIRKYTEPLKGQCEPWMSNLEDLEKYLGNDLTIGGVDAAKPLFTKTTEEGLAVQKSMDALVAELNTIAATITPAGKK